MYRGPKTWALVPNYIKNSMNVTEFKNRIKLWKPLGCMCKVYIPNLGYL